MRKYYANHGAIDTARIALSGSLDRGDVRVYYGSRKPELIIECKNHKQVQRYKVAEWWEQAKTECENYRNHCSDTNRKFTPVLCVKLPQMSAMLVKDVDGERLIWL